MKKFILSSLLLFGVSVVTSCTSNTKDEISLDVIDKQAAIKFENDMIDFHTINAGEKVTGSFTFKNTGKNDLVISDVSANCGCTVADYPRGVIKPQQKGMISVTYDSEGSKGMHVVKKITVVSNTNPSRNILTIVADVK